MTNKNKTISYLLGLLLSILLILIMLIGCISSSIFNKTYIKKVLHKTDYYYGMYVIIQDDMKSDIMPSGFEENVLDNVVTEDKIREDVGKVLDSIYDNKKVEISTEEMKKTLEENVQKQIAEKNFKVTDENKKGIEEFENSVINIYKDNITYSSDSINQIGKYIKRANTILTILVWILVIISITLGVIVFRMNRPVLGISFTVAGAFFVILNLYSGTAIVVNNILMFNWAFSKVITHIVNKLLANMYVIGGIMAVMGITEIVICEYLRAKIFVKYNRKR